MLADKVVKGAKLLDDHGPADWRDSIDLGRLNMYDIEECVLGQLYIDFFVGQSMLGITIHESIELGFWRDVDEDYAELTKAWTNYLGGE